MNLSTKQRVTNVENELMVTRGKGMGDDKLGDWTDISTLLYIK